MSSAVARYFRMHGEKDDQVKLIVRLRLDHDNGNVWLSCQVLSTSGFPHIQECYFIHNDREMPLKIKKMAKIPLKFVYWKSLDNSDVSVNYFTGRY